MSELPGAQVHDPQESQNLTPLQHVQQTAKHVAQSTGEAVKTLSSKGSQDHPLRKHEVKLKTECFTPMQHAQLTTKEIAHSTGEAVEKPGSKLEDDLWGQTVGAEMKLQSKSNATRHQYSTPKRHVAPDSRKLGSSERTSDSLNITPLQRAELTAQRVAKSTGNSLEKLSASENAVPLHKQNGWLNHESIDLPASGAEKSRYKHSNVPLTPGIDNVSNTVSSESELGNSEYSGKSTSSESERVTLDHCNPADIDYQERFSSFEKVKRTAEMVAESTGEAVQKLSTSFDYSI